MTRNSLAASLLQWLSAAGYLTVFAVPGLVVIGVLTDHPFLAVGVVLLVLPLVRVVLGEQRHAPPLWSEPVALFLHNLPVAYALSFLATLVWLASHLHQHPLQSNVDALGLGLSLWTMMGFATCPGHDLLHRKSVVDARIGRWVTGAAGYPILGFEHPAHHARHGDSSGGEWPRADEGAWEFARRRCVLTMRIAVARHRIVASEMDSIGALRWKAGHLAEPCVAMAVVWLMLTIMGGLKASIAYLGAAAGVWVAIQLLTYIQHWGLGIDHLEDAHLRPYAWEDRCRVQAWLTCNLSLHQAHHEANGLPYYRIGPSAYAPLLPAGYVVLLFLCMVKPAWMALMTPALARWKANSKDRRSPGRRVSCFG